VLRDTYRKSNMVFHELHRADINAVLIIGHDFVIRDSNAKGEEFLAKFPGAEEHSKLKEMVTLTSKGESVRNEEVAFSLQRKPFYFLMKA
jgi:hypothetical protein